MKHQENKRERKGERAVERERDEKNYIGRKKVKDLNIYR